MSSYPSTIENGGGEQLTFLRVVPTGGGDRLEVEVQARPGAGSPMHVHYLQEEAMTVASGRIGYQLEGGQPQYAGPGQTVVFRAGEAHKWWNAGDGELTGRGECGRR